MSTATWVQWFFSFFQSRSKMSSERFQNWTVTTPYLDLHCELGEGPYYEAATHSLRFVDIKKRRLHTVSLNDGPQSLKTIQLDMPVGVTADIKGVDPSKKILVGGKHGLYVLDRKSKKYELLKRFYDDETFAERQRSNDGAVDPEGRFWVGTMNDFWVGDPQPEGTLLRFSSDLARETMHQPVTIPNSVGWSPDHKTLYFVHSTAKQILAFDYAAKTGTISNERIFYQHPGAGDPDGFKIDEEGYLWQAFYGGGNVLRISPKGEVVGEIKYSANCITCPVFVGTELWVTTADDGEGKFGGGVFKVDVGVKGLKDFEFQLDAGIADL